MPLASELKDPEAINKLPGLKAKYEADERFKLEQMRREQLVAQSAASNMR